MECGEGCGGRGERLESRLRVGRLVRRFVFIEGMETRVFANLGEWGLSVRGFAFCRFTRESRGEGKRCGERPLRMVIEGVDARGWWLGYLGREIRERKPEPDHLLVCEYVRGGAASGWGKRISG